MQKRHLASIPNFTLNSWVNILMTSAFHTTGNATVDVNKDFDVTMRVCLTCARYRRTILIVVCGVAVLYLLVVLKTTGLLTTPREKNKEDASKFLVVERKPNRKARTRFTFRSSDFTNVVLPSSSSSANLSTLSKNLTVVTAYFNIGSFIKGDVDLFQPELYRRWMTIFSRINNPVVAYFDTDNDAAYFKIVRSSLPNHLTRVVKVSRNSLWSFHLVPYIKELFEQAWYPKHSPNTISAEYSAAMHAKYELIKRTIIENPFRTQFVCWLDVGLFRDLVPALPIPSLPSGPPFQLSVPDGFDAERIAYSEVFPREGRLDAEVIVAANLVWVCGCFFLGRVDVLFHWTLEYMEGVEKMLEQRWMSTDQQVIYWIYNENLHKTRIQTYADGTEQFSSWFYLGYLSKVTGERNNSSELALTSVDLV